MSDYMNYLARRVGYATYDKYLHGEHWMLFSEGMRKKSCECCRRTENLQIHHITYDRLGEELPFDVVTVCGTCHIAIHEIASNGTPLNRAHIVYKQKKNSRRKNEWVSWFKLLNNSKKETLDHLRSFLVERGLSDGEKATDKAFRLGFVKDEEGKERWNVKKYIKMMQADKKIKKCLAHGKDVHPMMHRHALMRAPNPHGNTSVDFSLQPGDVLPGADTA